MNAWSVDEVLNCIDCSIYCQTPDLDVFLSIITDICLTPLPLSGATEWWVGAAFLHNSDCHGFMGSIGQVRYLWRNDCCSWKSRSNSKEAVTRNKECDGRGCAIRRSSEICEVYSQQYQNQEHLQSYSKIVWWTLVIECSNLVRLSNVYYRMWYVVCSVVFSEITQYFIQ